MVRLLIVAPDAPFRNSVRFALEAEGYDVTAFATAQDVGERPSAFRCAVVDHHGLDGDSARDRRFMTDFGPVVLLVNNARHPLAGLSFCTLTKPSLGPALSAAVKAAIASRDTTQ